MTAKEVEIVNYLKLLIDISCARVANLIHFTNFHILVVKVAFNALDVQFDYKRKRIGMHVLHKEQINKTIIYGDTMTSHSVPVNLCYEDLGKFLRSCIGKDTKHLLQHKQLFFKSFFEGKSSLKNNRERNIEYIG